MCGHSLRAAEAAACSAAQPMRPCSAYHLFIQRSRMLTRAITCVRAYYACLLPCKACCKRRRLLRAELRMRSGRCAADCDCRADRGALMTLVLYHLFSNVHCHKCAAHCCPLHIMFTHMSRNIPPLRSNGALAALLMA